MKLSFLDNAAVLYVPVVFIAVCLILWYLRTLLTGTSKAKSDSTIAMDSDGEVSEGVGEVSGGGKHGAAEGLRRRQLGRGQVREEAIHEASIDTKGMSKKEKMKVFKAIKKEQKQNDRLANEEERRRIADERTNRDLLNARDERIMQEKEEDALQLLREEKKRKDDIDYQDWVGEIQVEEEGVMGHHEDTEASIREYLVNVAPKEHKVMELESMAKVLGVTVERLCSIVDSLLEAGDRNHQHSRESEYEPSICGIYDERGRFYFITDEEIEAIKRFIVLRGRFTISELSTECNRVVDLCESSDQAVGIASQS
eukprot:Tbor_TRINITY_DN5332_c0_g1::TRINITY_DN5332_c0_g1_i1::g.5151::m.5151